jgi:hypothetical protein
VGKNRQIIPLVGRKRHSPGAGTFNYATATSGVKVAQHPQGLTLIPARDGGARWRIVISLLAKLCDKATK